LRRKQLKCSPVLSGEGLSNFQEVKMMAERILGYVKANKRRFIEVLLPVIILSVAVYSSPAKASEENRPEAAERTAKTAEEKMVMASATEVTVSAGVTEDTTEAETEAGIAEAATTVDLDEKEENKTGKQTDEHSNEQMSETAYRIKPLQDKLAQMPAETVDSYVSAFSDMKTHWSRQVVGKLTGLGIIAGYDGRFWPSDPVQADQFIKMAVLSMGYKIEQETEYWAQPYIDTALKEGLIEKGDFSDYKKPLSREEMARIVVRTALKVDEKPDNKYDPYIIGKISDYEDISDHLKQFVIDGYRLGLVQGSSGKFHPKDTLTRAEAAAVIIRILDATERKPTIPGEGEMIRFLDSRGNPTVIFPGSVRELFDVAKATEAALPKAKGFVNFFIGDDGKYISAHMYKDKASYDRSIFGKVASFKIAYNVKDTAYAYTLNVWNDELYEELFPDFIRKVFKTIFEEDAQKAIQLHDKYMNQRYTRTDGLNDYTTTRINDRNTTFLRFDDNSFAIQIKLKGLK